jgi:hypothetical protein
MALRPLLITVAVLVAAVVSVGCDEVHSFKFINRTDSEIHLTYSISISTGEFVGERTYVLARGQSIDTETDRALSGESGLRLFRTGRTLRVRAMAGERVVLDNVYTYEDLKARDFTIEITE